ncbi:MAG: hypothetical protein U0269_32375 [Polyangiales bacterium]
MKMGLGRVAIIAALALASVTSGCVTPEMQAFGRLSPQPNIDLPRRRISLALDVSRMVADDFTARSEGIMDVPVTGFRDSIASGYWSSVSLYFVPRGAPRFTLSITQCDLDFVPSTIRVSRSYSNVMAARARIQYLAQLKNPDGDVVGRARGEIVSSVEWTSVGGAGRAAEDALALMWVDITDRLLVHIPMPAMPPQDNPGSSGGEQPPNQQRRVQTW